MALSIFTLSAQAQTARAPATKNTHLRKIAQHYNKLNYEMAIELLPKAVTSAGKKEQEHLWLDLMSGVLHYSIQDTAASEAAFKRAFERAPGAKLPIKDPSQTLIQRFEEIRKAHEQERKVKQSPPPTAAAPVLPRTISKWGLVAKLRELEAEVDKWANGPVPKPLTDAFRSIYDQAAKAQSPEERRAIASAIDRWIELFRAGDVEGVNDLAADTVPVKGNAPEQAMTRSSDEPKTGPEQLRRAISPGVLHERVRRMREWLVGKSEAGNAPQALKLLEQLNEHLRTLEASTTAHERMLIAINLDVFEVQMSTQLDWRIQGSNPQVIAIESE